MRSSISWTQVGSLLLLDWVVLISWIAYNEYQPRLLERFGYGAQSFEFLWVQTLILVVTPPVAGYLTDRLCRRGGTRLATVTGGVSATAMIFMATAVALAGEATPGVSLVFPGLIVLWLIAMNVFHSPAISMLELYAPPQMLTGVAALFTVLAGLTAAVEPAVTSLLDSLGAARTFGLGGLLLLVAGAGFLRASGSFRLRSGEPLGTSPLRLGYVAVLGLGLVLGLLDATMNDLLPAWIGRHGDLIGGVDPPYQSSILYAAAALAAWPLGQLGNRWSPLPLALAGGTAGLLLSVGAWAASGRAAHAMLWLLPAAYSALAVAALPVALRSLSRDNRVLGVGLLFSGAELSSGIIKILLSR